jgi:hypothetical protein
MRFVYYVVLLSPLLASGGQTAKHPQKPGKCDDYSEQKKKSSLTSELPYLVTSSRNIVSITNVLVTYLY